MKKDLLVTLEEFEESEKYWSWKLSGELTDAKLLRDYPETHEYEKAIYPIEFREQLNERLFQVSKNNDLSLYIILLTVFKILLSKHTGQSEIIVASPIYTWENSEYNKFVAFRDFLDPRMTFKELLMSVKQTVVEGYKNEHYPIEKLIEYLELDESLLFRNIFLYEQIHEKEFVEKIINSPVNDIAFSISKNHVELEGEIIYNAKLFNKETIQKVFERYSRILAQVMSKTDMEISGIELMAEEEKKQILFEFNNSQEAYPEEKTIHELFEQQVEKTPGNAAVHSAVDLNTIFTESKSDKIEMNQWGDLENCCFKKSKYIYQCDLELYGKKSGYKILKTHLHRSVVVDNNTLNIINSFDGETNVKSIFSSIKNKNLKIPVYTVKPDDILEIVIRFSEKNDILLDGKFENFVHLVKVLYTNHLIELVGINFSKVSVKNLIGARWAPAESFNERILSNDILVQNKELSKARVLLLGDTPGMPSVGLLYLASYLRRNGIKTYCRFNDINSEYSLLKKEIEGLLRTIQPEVVAVSMKWFPYIVRVFEICRIVKEYSPRVRVVVGGNTASYYGEKVIRNEYVDYVILGDGEVPLLKICQGFGAEDIPNCVFKKNGKIITNPSTYVQDETNSSAIYLSHLDEILISTCSPLFGSFFIYTHKGCSMNCIYCAGCREAQAKIFNRTTMHNRSVEEVRKDIIEAKKYTSTFTFDFNAPNEKLVEYCKRIWEGIDLSSHFCIYVNVIPPSPQLVKLVNRTFKYVYCELDMASLSERHRKQLFLLGLIKPQPSDDEIFTFLDECEKYDNNEIRINLINGLPYFTEEDMEYSEKILSKIMSSYSCFRDLHWGRLHAQPAAPIVEDAGKYDMYSLASTFEDFLKFGEINFSSDTTFSDIEYPYIYFKDEQLNSKVSRYYAETNFKLVNYKNNKESQLIVNKNFSYEVVNKRANQLANVLRNKGVAADSLVGIIVQDPLNIIVGLLGILKAGGAYLPLDPGYPLKAREYILKDSNMQVLVTEKSKKIEESLPEAASSMPVILTDEDSLADYGTSNLEVVNKPTDLAYVIYTSGTTGKPKGTLVRHRGLVNFANWRIQAYRYSEKDVTLQLLSYTFDGFFTNFYSSLLSGGTLIMVPESRKLDYEYVKEIIREKGVTNTSLVPGMYEVIIDSCTPEDLKTLRFVVLAGEQCKADLIKRSKEKAPNNLLINEYGPTEATVTSAVNLELDEFNTAIVGKPIFNTRLYILDSFLQPVPLNVAGELCISGPGLARGYLNNPDLTSEKLIVLQNKGFLGDSGGRFFKKAPLAAGGRLYKTGDLARWLTDGKIECLGRMDHQVKIRGFRIELGEIESKLLTHEEIKEAVVIAKENEKGDKFLCAYYVEKAGKQPGLLQSNANTLREYLSKSLPDYMIPYYFVPIEKIPLTRNGKVDRKALPEPEVKKGEEYIAPINELEEKLTEIWSDVLGIEKNVISMNSNFFILGGHSLKATAMVSKIHKELNAKVPLDMVFKMPTIRELSGQISKTAEEKFTSIPIAEKKEYYALSSGQRRLYFLQQMDIESTAYNVNLLLPLGKNIERNKLESTVKKLIARHESLRTSFEMVKEEPVQRIHDYDNVEFKIEYYEINTPPFRPLRGHRHFSQEGSFTPPNSNEYTQLETNFIKNSFHHFDLTQVPLIRSGIIKRPDNSHIWMVEMHHIMSDGTSMSILTEDFMAFYSGKELPELRIQYKDFSQWQNHLFESGRIKAQEDYWLELYSDSKEIPQLQLPADCKRPEVFNYAGGSYSFILEREDAIEFKALDSRHGGTLYMNILAALDTLFYKYTGQTDIIIGCGIAGRRHADLQGIIGMFVNTLAMRNYPEEGKTYESFLKEVIAHSVEAFENQDMQFEELVDKLELERDASRNPLFDIMMVVQNFKRANVNVKVGEDVSNRDNSGQVELLPAPDENLPSIDYENHTAKFDMTFFIQEEGEDFFIAVEYYTAIFKIETIARFVQHFKKIIKEVATNPAIRLGDIDIVSEQEKQQLLFQFNDTETPYPREKTIGDLFEEQVNKAPHCVAVVGTVVGTRFISSVTYRELDRKSNQVATYLDEKGVVPNQSVGMIMDRSISMLVVIVGILKAGGAYVPISPSFPEERIKIMIEDSGMRILIGQKRYIKTLNRVQWECRDLDTFLCIDSEDVHCEDEVEENELMNRKLWEYVGETAVDEVTGGGWNSSYTGRPIPKEEMDEYGNNILKKLEPLLHKDMRVLEIGAASGISMYRIAPKVGFYYGTDLSSIIIEKNIDRVKKEGHKNIKLCCLAAHEIHQLDEREFDLVILNSVIQCFNGHNYLKKVIRKAIHLMKSSGYIFIGDIMDQELKEDLTADLVKFRQANRGMNYKTKVDWSEELFISRRFWEDLVLDYPEIHDIEFSDKIYTLENELTKFRYDTLVYIEKTKVEKERKKRNERHKKQHDLRTLRKYRTGKLTTALESGNLAYIIYTSGSTGKPKGTLTTHYNVTRVVRNTNYIEFQPEDRVLQLSDYAFDGSVFDIYGALLNGSTLVMVSREDMLEIGTLCGLIKREKISVFFVTTAFFNALVDVELESLSSIRKVLFGGERVSVKHTTKALEYLGRDRILHVYGPTETTVYATYYKINEVNDNQITIPIGSPISNTTVYILDSYSRLVPLGVNGEIYIGGPGVCKGYLNDEALTKEKFVPNPFIEGEMLYRTGDLGRWLADGNIEFMGRLDQQVKLRGFRIELGEIESCLLTHDTIKEALVVAKDDETNGKHLCAYIVCTGETAYEKKLDTTELREYLSLTLPDYMIPLYFVQMEKMPLTTNGKVDQKALPDPQSGLLKEGYIPPCNEVEEKLVQAWEEVLGVGRIGITDNFFEVGGDSIKAIQVSARLKKYGLEFKISNLFLNPTIKELGKCVTETQRAIHRGIVEGEVELTPIQRWFFQSDFTGNHHFNQAVMLYRNSGNGFDEAILKKVFTKIVEHHDALRMVYEARENEVIQVNRGIDGKLFDFEVIDFKDADDRDDDIKNRIEKEADRIQQGIDLKRGPLVKIGLFKTSGGDHLLIVIHHLVVDGVSWRILLEDFSTGCRQLERGEKIKFQDKTDSFKDWSEQIKQYAQSNKLLRELEYWEKVGDTKIQGISRDHEIAWERKKLKYARDITMSLDEEKTGMLIKKVNQAYNTEINDILLTALAMAFSDWQGLESVAVNLEGHGREGVIEGLDISRTVGWFTSRYPVILKVEKSKELSYKIKFVKEILRQIPAKGIGHGILRYLTPWEKKKRKFSQLEPGISFNYLGQFGGESEQGFFQVSPLNPGQAVSPDLPQVYAIDINGMITDRKLGLTFRYNSFEYEQTSIEALVSSYKSNLIKIIDHCSHKKDRELTPSDVGWSKLSIDDLRWIEKYLAVHWGKDLEIKQIYPLTPMQEGMLYHSLRSTQSGMSGTYFDQMGFIIKGEINRSFLENSFNTIIGRYDIFRTVFIYERLQLPLQVVLKERKAKIGYKDISHLSKDEQELYIEEFKRKNRQKGVDLARDILVAISLFKTSENSWELVWSFHHILMDGWCLGIIFKELVQTYLLLKQGKPVELDPGTPYRNYIKWLEDQDKQEGLRYWKRYLDGYQQLASFRQTRQSSGENNHQYKLEEYTVVFNEVLTSNLNEIAVKNQVTINSVFQILWGILLQEYNNTDDVVFGAVVSGRTPEVEGIENMVGLFINTLPVRLRKQEGQTFSQLLRDAQKKEILSKSYEYIPLPEIQSNCLLKGNLFDHIVVLQNYPLREITKETGSEEKLGFSIEEKEAKDQTNYNLNIIVGPRKGLLVKFNYNSLVYEADFIKRLASHFKEIVKKVAENPDIPLTDIDMLPEEEKSKILLESHINKGGENYDF